MQEVEDLKPKISKILKKYIDSGEIETRMTETREDIPLKWLKIKKNRTIKMRLLNARKAKRQSSNSGDARKNKGRCTL